MDWPRLWRWHRDPATFEPADFDKLVRSGIRVFHPAVDLNATDPFVAARRWLQDWNGFLDSRRAEFVRIAAPADIDAAAESGRVGVVLGLQNANHFRTVEDVSLFYGLGQRISQLTYNSGNLVGAGCAARRDEGLTAFGAAVIAEMNRLGMAVDISHTGDCTSLDAIEASARPVLATHSNCRALVPRHPRCKPDYVIRRLAARGGVIGVTSIRRFVSNDEPTTIDHVLDHFDYIARLVGVEHAGIGSDNSLDGRDRGRYRMDIRGLDHPLRIYNLTEGLVRRGYTDRTIRLILGGNFRRALDAIWS
jgi:membrane dipeptidase